VDGWECWACQERSDTGGAAGLAAHNATVEHAVRDLVLMCDEAENAGVRVRSALGRLKRVIGPPLLLGAAVFIPGEKAP
jgi:hypothetical protein